MRFIAWTSIVRIIHLRAVSHSNWPGLSVSSKNDRLGPGGNDIANNDDHCDKIIIIILLLFIVSKPFSIFRRMNVWHSIGAADIGRLLNVKFKKNISSARTSALHVYNSRYQQHDNRNNPTGYVRSNMIEAEPIEIGTVGHQDCLVWIVLIEIVTMNNRVIVELFGSID